MPGSRPRLPTRRQHRCGCGCGCGCGYAYACGGSRGGDRGRVLACGRGAAVHRRERILAGQLMEAAAAEEEPASLLDLGQPATTDWGGAEEVVAVVVAVVVVAVVAVAVPLQSSGLAAGLIRTVSLNSHASGPPYHVCAPSSPSSPFSSPSCALSSHACAPSPPHCYPRAATAHEPAFGPSAAVLLRSNRLHRLPRPPPSVQRRSTASRAWPRRSATPAFSRTRGGISKERWATRPVGARVQ